MAVLRTVSTHKRRQVLSRDRHAHLLVERLSSTPPGEDGKVTLLLSGYVRSKALSVNSLLHIPGLGDYQMSQVGWLGGWVGGCEMITSV